MTISARDRVQELLDTFAVPGAEAVELLCDRHPSDRTAFTVVQSDLGFEDLTYGELRGKSVRFAAALAALGVRRGDTVATLMGPCAELVVALLGIWRLGAVDVPLSTDFAHDAIAFRVQATGARLVICDADQRRKLLPPGGVPNDASPLVVVARGEAFGHDVAFAEMSAGTAAFAEMSAGTAAFSGLDAEAASLGGLPSPGTPEPSIFVGDQDFGLDVRAGDVFWNMADPGRDHGPYFALLEPLAPGARSLLVSAGFTTELTWAVLKKFEVTNFAAGPTVYETLRAGTAPARGHALRRASSAGEPLAADVVEWGRGVFGLEIREHYGQTEHGKAQRIVPRRERAGGARND